MAGVEFIQRVQSPLEDAMIELAAIVSSWSDLTEKQMPPWLFVLSGRVDRLEAALQAYMEAVHTHALPVVRDVDRASRQQPRMR